jgi:hypothetical protein
VKKRFIILLLLSILVNEGRAQELKKEKKFFSSQISAGIVEGEHNTSFHVEILNGIRYKTWFGGIGTGLDYYYFRSIPVYLSGVKYLSPRNHSFFVQGDAGLNFAWNNKTFTAWNEVNDEFKPGLYWNGSLGFATGLDRKNSFSFGLGYSQKNLKEIKEIAVMCFNPPCENSVETYRYNLKRLTLRIGWQFNYSR